MGYAPTYLLKNWVLEIHYEIYLRFFFEHAINITQ